jgi:Sds3-like
MAYSPGPVSPTGLHPRARSLSPVPPPGSSNAPQQSKRDKRRTQLQDRLHDLTVTFSQNRDSQFRQQLHALQCDMTLINNADPYEMSPLPDSPEEIAQLIETTVGGGKFGKEMATISGSWYSRFVQEINEVKEDRDVELVAVMVSFCTTPVFLYLISS